MNKAKWNFMYDYERLKKVFSANWSQTSKWCDYSIRERIMSIILFLAERRAVLGDSKYNNYYYLNINYDKGEEDTGLNIKLKMKYTTLLGNTKYADVSQTDIEKIDNNEKYSLSSFIKLNEKQYIYNEIVAFLNEEWEWEHDPGDLLGYYYTATITLKKEDPENMSSNYIWLSGNSSSPAYIIEHINQTEKKIGLKRKSTETYAQTEARNRAWVVGSIVYLSLTYINEHSINSFCLIDTSDDSVIASEELSPINLCCEASVWFWQNQNVGFYDLYCLCKEWSTTGYNGILYFLCNDEFGFNYRNSSYTCPSWTALLNQYADNNDGQPMTLFFLFKYLQNWLRQSDDEKKWIGHIHKPGKWNTGGTVTAPQNLSLGTAKTTEDVEYKKKNTFLRLTDLETLCDGYDHFTNSETEAQDDTEHGIGQYTNYFTILDNWYDWSHGNIWREIKPFNFDVIMPIGIVSDTPRFIAPNGDRVLWQKRHLGDLKIFRMIQDTNSPYNSITEALDVENQNIQNISLSSAGFPYFKQNTLGCGDSYTTVNSSRETEIGFYGEVKGTTKNDDSTAEYADVDDLYNAFQIK